MFVNLADLGKSGWICQILPDWQCEIEKNMDPQKDGIQRYGAVTGHCDIL